MTFCKSDFQSLLKSLDIHSGDLLFVHSGMDRVGGDAHDAISLIETLMEQVGPTGTVLMPSYFWRGKVGRPPEGSLFDVRRTPSQVGLLTEIFRRMPQTYRSEHYWVPVCGQGKLAKELLSGQAEILHPFAPESTFARLLNYETKVVGLGVSLNTSSLAHLPDFELERFYSVKVFSEAPIQGQLIDHEGCLKTVATYVVNSEVMANYRPAKLFEISPRLKESLHRFDQGSTIYFSYSLTAYYREAIRIGRDSLSCKQLPPWISPLSSVNRD